MDVKKELSRRYLEQWRRIQKQELALAETVICQTGLVEKTLNKLVAAGKAALVKRTVRAFEQGDTTLVKRVMDQTGMFRTALSLAETMYPEECRRIHAQKRELAEKVMDELVAEGTVRVRKNAQGQKEYLICGCGGHDT